MNYVLLLVKASQFTQESLPVTQRIESKLCSISSILILAMLKKKRKLKFCHIQKLLRKFINLRAILSRQSYMTNFNRKYLVPIVLMLPAIAAFNFIIKKSIPLFLIFIIERIMSVFDEVFKLQEIFLAQQISEQLALRDIHDTQIAQKIIEICKRSNDEEDFMSQVANLNISISENFVNSLYDTIRQKLPRKLEPTHQPSHVPESHPMTKMQEQRQFESQNRQHNFPGLAIPDGDQIDLDLDLPVDNQQPPKEQITKKQEHSIKKRQNIDISRSRSRSRQKRQRSESREFKHKKDRKKQKSHKKQRSNSYQRDHKKKKHKQRSRSRSEQRHKRYESYHQRDEKKNNRPQLKILEVGKIYKGKVTKVNKMGCFVHIFNVINNKPAIVHSSHVRQQPTEDITKIVKQGLFIWVKVLEILQDRIRLSMKEVNQYNGKQFNKKQTKKEQETLPRDAHTGVIGSLTGIKIEHEEDVDNQGRNNYNDQWQLSRLNYMGVVGKKVRKNVDEDIEDINIQVNDRQPPFLTGQTTKTGINLSPVKVIKNPEGTLNRQAMNALQYAKQRRQIREQQNKNEVRDLNKVLEEVTPQKSEPRKYFKTSNLTIKEQKQSLPIFQYKKELVQACYDNNILIIIGQTGSGKTTQITQYLYEAGFHKRGRIGCTQPRRVAAMSVAKRVCQEMNVKLGDQVGYSIRFEDHTSSKTIIKYMTDGMLLREALVDKYLSQYSVIMLDQAHERTINTDVLFGILKKVAQKRKDFLLIVTSATLEARKFSSYFFDCKIFSIPGRTYNVQILYAKQPETDYLDASLMCVMQIHVDQPPGDILLFLTGQQQIDTACQILNERLRRFGNQIPQLIILPVYSALPSELQSKIFEPAPPGKRKCVIATNIAQASLTIDGIFYVVDPGFAKIKIYNSKLGMDTLVVAPISQASAKQRAGRAGRTGPGKCYRIYTQQAYKNEMLPTSVPEIQRANLANTVLELKAMGINDLINFDFMDAPPVQTLIVALQQLYYLSALDDEGLLTKLGRKMAQFPLQPPLSKMLLTSIDFSCTEQIITIIAMLSVQNIFYRPKEKQALADQKKTKFNHFEGDHLTYLQVFQAWKNQGYSASWSKQNFIQQRSLRRAEDVRKQLLELLQRYKFPIKSCGKNYSLIRKTIVSGFFFHAARKDSKGGYRTLIDDHQVYIHPSSALFNKEPEWVIYHELVFTTKQYMRQVCTINPKWLIDVAPNFFKFTDELGFTRKKRNEKLDPLDQRYGDPNAWRLSKRKG